MYTKRSYNRSLSRLAIFKKIYHVIGMFKSMELVGDSSDRKMMKAKHFSYHSWEKKKRKEDKEKKIKLKKRKKEKKRKKKRKKIL